MRLIVDVHHVLDGELGVALRGGQALVAEEFLDGAQVGSLFQHVRAEGVAQGVGMNFGDSPLATAMRLTMRPTLRVVRRPPRWLTSRAAVPFSGRFFSVASSR